MFSSRDRAKHLYELTNTYWDVIIVGGGITGAGVLLDAVSRGLKVALIEMHDFASGTSSKSTKLIHGGLRYLKNFEISLVREVGKERAIVYSNARHLVRPEPMLLPIYQDGSIGKITGSIGLWFYDLLAEVDKTERRRMLSLEETLAQEPLLKREGLLGSGLYYEYRTDDARLTLAIVKKAVELGGLALNYCKVSAFEYTDDLISGIRCKDLLDNSEFTCTARCIVNATGPWTESVMSLDSMSSRPPQKLLLSKGIHIAIPYASLPINQSLYFDVHQDGRMIFAIPRDNAVYIGTTDTIYEGPLDAVNVEDDEIRYLLRAVHSVFDQKRISIQDVIGSWAGLRPLIYEEGKSPGELSRRDEVFQSPTGLITIAGGKLTGYRRMAERVVDLIMEKKLVGVSPKESQTQHLHLSGAEFDDENDLHATYTDLCTTYPQFTRQQIAKLFYRYGTATVMILREAADSGASSDDLLQAEIRYSIDHEMVHYVSDFIFRRTSDFFFDRDYLARRITSVLAFFEKEGISRAAHSESESSAIMGF